MARYKVPGVSIAVIDDGRLDWAQGYGVTQSAVTDPVTTETLFQAASISKPVAAATVLRLVQEGRLSLSVDINRYLQAWQVPASQYTEERPVTLRDLLSHTAGATVHGFPGYPRGQTLPTLAQILDGAEPANSPPVRIDMMPGRVYRYSGGGYEIMELAVEEATGQPLEALAADLVFDPLGMGRSTFSQPLPESLEGVAARGHGFDGVSVAGGWHVYPEQAAAGLWSTPTDLARFAIELMNAYKGRSDEWLDKATATLMLTEVVDGIGLGPGIHGEGVALHFDHSGWSRGYRTYFIAYPHTGDGLVVMANGDGAHDLINEIVRAVARVYGWPDFSPEERVVASVGSSVLNRYAGTYDIARYGFQLDVEYEDDHFVVRTPRGSMYTFYPLSDTEYVAIEDGAILRFVEGEDGRPGVELWGTSGTLVGEP